MIGSEMPGDCRLALKPGSRLRAVGVRGWHPRPLPAGPPRPRVSCRVSRPVAGQPGAGREGCAAQSGRGGSRGLPEAPPPAGCRPPRAVGGGPGRGCGSGARRAWGAVPGRGMLGVLPHRAPGHSPASPPRPPVPEVRRAFRKRLGGSSRRGVPGGSRDPSAPPSPPPESTGGRDRSLHAPGPLPSLLGAQPPGTRVKKCRLRISESRLQPELGALLAQVWPSV